MHLRYNLQLQLPPVTMYISWHHSLRPLDMYFQIDNYPVVFHQKNSVDEMLKKQKMHFHLTSCRLPQLQSKTKKNTRKNEPRVKYLTSSKYSAKMMKLSKESLHMYNPLELKGNGMERLHCMKEFILNGSKNPEKHCSGNSFGMEMCGNELSLQGTSTGSQPNSSQSHKSMDRSSAESNDQISSKTHKQYVDIPVPSNPALTEESCSIVSEAGDLNSEAIFQELAETDRSSKNCNREENSPKDIKCFSDGIEKSSTADNDKSAEENKSISQIMIPQVGSEKEELRKRESNTARGFTRRESREGRQSSRLTYIPSTPASLFLSDEIYELPKGVSPSKALLELRQTFCENIKRETEQLQFDLQELYLKKQLHQR